MGKMKYMTKVIFFDTDCISSFLWTNTEYLLVHTFQNNMQIPRQVYNEISKVLHLKTKVDTMISNNNLSIIDIEIDSNEEDLYIQLTLYNSKSKLPLIGKGEAAAIVLTKKQNGILASNNFKDVKYYVEKYNLAHIATENIMKSVVDDGIITIDQADGIWIKMIAKKRKLPYPTFTDYLSSL